MIINTLFQKLFRLILMLFFRFDRWHTSPVGNRKYAQDIILELDMLPNRDSILELGCGLGDIVGKVQYKNKYFFDISPNVLRAAKFLQEMMFKRSFNVYEVFDFLENSVDCNMKFDAIVLVNWTHGYESKIIHERLSKLINTNLRKGGVLIFDVIENNHKYKHNHVIRNLINVDRFNIKVLDGYKFGRKLIFATLN